MLYRLTKTNLAITAMTYAALIAAMLAHGCAPAHAAPVVPMPAAIVLILCKTVVAGPPDQNAAYTGYENRDWATEHSMMVCRRQEVPVAPMGLIGTAPEHNVPGDEREPFTIQKCQRSGLMLGPAWDAGHRSSPYRFWRVACPVPIVRKNPDGTEDIIAWKLPDCGHRDTVRCEVDTEI